MECGYSFCINQGMWRGENKCEKNTTMNWEKYNEQEYNEQEKYKKKKKIVRLK